MAYGLFYKFIWQSDNGTEFKIHILKDGYSGAATQRALGGAPLLRRERNGNICGTSLEFDAECRVDGEFATLYTSSATDYLVNLYAGTELIWQGFITPELYSEPVIAPPYDVHIIATDGLGELKLSDYGAPGRMTLAGMLAYLLAPTGLELELDFVSSLRTDNTAVAATPSGVTVNLDHLSGRTYYEVLDALLGTFHAVLLQQQGAWLVVRETDVNALVSGSSVVSPFMGDEYPVTTFGSMPDVGVWPVGQLSQTVVPAKNGMTVSADNQWKENLFSDWGSTKTGATWHAGTTQRVPYAYYDENLGRVVRGYKTITVERFGYYSANRSGSLTFVSDTLSWAPTQDLSLTLKLACERYGFEACAYTVKVKVNAYAAGGAAKTLYLTPDGMLSATAQTAKEGTVTTQDYHSPEEIAITIPVFSQAANAGIASVGSVEVTFTGGEATSGNTHYSTLLVCGCTLAPVNMASGYLVRTVLDNSARGSGDDVAMVVSDNSDKEIEAVMINNAVLFASDGRIVEEWATGAISMMSLAELITRDYCLSIATPRLRVDGTLNVPASPAALPFLFLSRADAIGVALYFLPDTWDWDLYRDELKVSMVSLPAAAITVSSETRVVGSSGADGLATGKNTGKVSPATGGVSKLSQLSDVSLDDLAAGQMLKYNATSQKWENADTLLELVNIGTAASPVYAVHVKASLSDGTPIAGLFSDGFVSAGGVSSGGGGGTGSVSLSDNGDNTYALAVGTVTASALATKDYVDAAVAGGGGVSASLAVNGTYANCYDLTVDGTTATALATRDYVQAQGYITSYVNNYLSGVSASGTTITFSRKGLSALTLILAASNIPTLTSAKISDFSTAANSAITKATIDALDVDAGTLDGHAPAYFAVDANVVHLTGTETISGAKTFTGKLSMTQYHSNFPGHLYHNLYESERAVYEHFYPDGTASGDAATVAHLRVWNGTGITALILNGSDGTLKWNGNNILFAGAVGSASLPVYSTPSGLAAITSLALGNGAISGGNGSFGGTLAVTGVATLSSYLKVTGNRVYIGGSENNSHYIEYANGAFHVVGNLYADGYVSAGGQSSGGGGTITVDDTFSSTSTNPVQNKVIYAAIGDVETLLAAI